MSKFKYAGFAALLLLCAFLVTGVLGVSGMLGEYGNTGDVSNIERSVEARRKVASVQASARENLQVESNKQILFGDMHVHTTFSIDAMIFSLPALEGEGAHPPADACDYARFCSALDFWSINDHAFGLSPINWRETKESIRQCNAVTSPTNPDTVAFLGYEWTQVSFNKESHYGHKNVIFKNITEEDVPARAIDASTETIGAGLETLTGFPVIFGLSGVAASLGQDYRNMLRVGREIGRVPDCDPDIHSKELPSDCRETAPTPADLFRKLEEGGYESLVIPHGNSWGLYTPPLSGWDKQLKGNQHNEKYQFLVEVFSGHGNAEEYRSYEPFTLNVDGKRFCPEETKQFLPLCRQAGRIIKRNCLAAGLAKDECAKRQIQAEHDVIYGDGMEGTLIGAQLADWLDAEQCRDCWAPSFSHRPKSSTQYALAIGDFDGDPENPRRFRFGMMASSDNHTARPGTGYKELDRRENTEATDATYLSNLVSFGELEPPLESTRLFIDGNSAPPASTVQHAERVGSFLMTGGLIAVHAEDKTRSEIWGALQKKEVYGTSGDRILLWFDLLNPDESGQIAPMGSEVELAENPLFRVRAVGAFKQKPGCPEYSTQALSAERLNHLCRGECYNPTDERKLITRIEVIRIRPQITKDEAVENLIEDTWLTHQCEPNPNGCVFEFEDPDFLSDGRESVYYVRAIEEPSLMVNGAPLKAVYNEEGFAESVEPCYGDSRRTPYQDDCLSMAEERAWSSPIFIDPLSVSKAAMGKRLR